MTIVIPTGTKRCGHLCSFESSDSQSECAFCQVLKYAPERLSKKMYGCTDCETRRMMYILAANGQSASKPEPAT